MNLPQKRYPIETGDPASISILLVGCGGTGSFAALHLARLAYEVKRKGGPELRLVFIDFDTVSEANLGRSNFCPVEVGRAKAAALAYRYSYAFGLEIVPVVRRFDSGVLAQFMAIARYDQTALTLVIGCVDSPAARAGIDAALKSPGVRKGLWWLDAGNDEHSGQVLIGNSLMVQPVIDPLMGRCLMLPLPSVQEPGLVGDRVWGLGSPQGGLPGAGKNPKPETPDPEPETLSCAELMALNAQSLMINQAMAGWLAVYAYRLLLAHDLDIYQTWIDLRGGSVRSVGITDKVARRGQGQLAVVGKPEMQTVQAFDGMIGAVGHCPNCGELTFEGRDTIVEEIGEEDTVFCPACNWQMYREDWDAEEARRVPA